MWLLFVSVGLSLVYLLAGEPARAAMADWLIATGQSTWVEHRVWTLVTSPLVEPAALSLLLQAIVMWTLIPSIERLWGTPRYLRFAVASSLAATIAGTLGGLWLGPSVPLNGLDPMIYASFVVLGREFSRQPVQVFGTIPMTGKQLMIGLLCFLALLIALEQDWVNGCAYLAAILTAVWFTSDRFSPEIWWYRLRGKPKAFTVLHGGRHRARSDSQWLN